MDKCMDKFLPCNEENGSPEMIKMSRLMTKPTRCVPSEDLDQHGHPPSLIRVFAMLAMSS